MEKDDILDFSNGIYSLQKLPHENAELLVGERLPQLAPNRPDLTFIAIAVDEHFEQWLGTKYTAVQVDQPNFNNKTWLQVTVKGVDDSNFYARIRPDKNLYLSNLIEFVDAWLQRSNYRYINLHALADYLNFIADRQIIEIEWN